MSASGPDSPQAEPAVPGLGLAVLAEVLYLVNLLLLPGLAFLALVAVYFRGIRHAPPLAACHLRQTLSASLWAGGLLLATNVIILLLGGYRSPDTFCAGQPDDLRDCLTFLSQAKDFLKLFFAGLFVVTAEHHLLDLKKRS